MNDLFTKRSANWNIFYINLSRCKVYLFAFFFKINMTYKTNENDNLNENVLQSTHQ